MPQNYKIKTITSDEAFISFEPSWKEFEKKTEHANYTCTFDWLYCWWKTFKNVNNNLTGYNKELLIICLYNDEELVAIAPLIRLHRKQYGIKVTFIEFLSQQLGSCYIDIISNDFSENYSKVIFKWVKENISYDLLFLKHIPEYSKSIEKTLMFSYACCPRIYLEQYVSFEGYIWKEYSKKLKQNIRTAFNRAQKENILLTRSIEKVTEQNFSEITRISAFKKLDNKGNKYDDQHQRIFLQEVLSKLDSNICFVKLRGINVAYRLNIVYNNNYYCIDASYDRNYKHYELGALSVDISIKDCFDKKYATHCMGPGLDVYKMKFTKNIVKLFIYIERGNTFMSLPYILALKRMLKRRESQFTLQLSKYINLN